MPAEYQLYEVSNRTIQGRFLLRPGPELNEIVRSTLARAHRKFGVEIVAASFLSNHFHILIGAASVEQTADFMGYFQGNLARRAGRLHDWSGPLWARRFDIEPVENDEADQVWRLRYVLEQGCKENLVWKPKDWPGVTTVRELVTGKPMRGLWLNRTAKYRSELRGEDRPLSDFQELEQFRLIPLPCWSHLPEDEYRRRVLRLIRGIEKDTNRRHLENRTTPIGRAQVLRHPPHHRPNSVKRSPIPWILTRSKMARERYRQAYRWFLAAYREASRRFRSGDLTVEFPRGCFLPGLSGAARARAPG